MTTLRELLEQGFEIDGQRFAWGVLVEDVAAALGLPAATSLRFHGGEAHGLPTILREAWAPAPGRPVSGVAFQLAAAARLDDLEVLAELRARFDADLGPGRHEWVEKGPERAHSVWPIEGATVRLFAYPAAWGFNWGRSTGRIDVHPGRERLAGPFLSVFRAADEPWARTPGELEVIAAPQLRDFRDPPWNRDEISLALTRPELRAPPAWVTPRLGPDRIGIWRHGPTCGIATDLFTLPFPAAAPPTLRHVRWSAGRGPGMATLDLGPGAELLLTDRGPAGLDAVVRRLTEMHVPIVRSEETDWW